jgi:hypothetical protein
MDFSSNGSNEIFFVDGAENTLTRKQGDALTSAAAHFLEIFDITHEVDVYISKRSELHTLVSNTSAWHMPPSFSGDNSIVCVFVDPNSDTKSMIDSLAHEMIHAWQVDRGDLIGRVWKGQDMSHLPYQFQPWEIEAHGQSKAIASLFFRDEPLSSNLKKDILEKTDSVFAEIISQVKTQQTKASLKKIATVAATLGLGALIGI